ncbi:MAG: zinc ribbon domain-containing protein [Anaerolineae bacterium]|nr:zinc ribbon domain-containing protein [Anaerolineae bacterium]
MDILTLILSLALVGGALTLVFYPLWRQARPPTLVDIDPPGRTLEEYEARYQAALAAVRDLMFDYEMGKVAAEDYAMLLPKTKLEAARIRRQIDQLGRQEFEIDPALDAEIETLVAQLRNDKPNGNEILHRDVEAEIEALKNTRFDACPNCGRFIQTGDAFCSSCGQSLANLNPNKNICRQCGSPVQADDAFCAKCGAALGRNLTTRKIPISPTADDE